MSLGQRARQAAWRRVALVTNPRGARSSTSIRGRFTEARPRRTKGTVRTQYLFRATPGRTPRRSAGAVVFCVEIRGMRRSAVLRDEAREQLSFASKYEECVGRPYSSDEARERLSLRRNTRNAPVGGRTRRFVGAHAFEH